MNAKMMSMRALKERMLQIMEMTHRLLIDLENFQAPKQRASAGYELRKIYPSRLLNPQQIKLLTKIASAPKGMRPEEVTKWTMKLGYHNPNAYGGFMKGHKPSLKRIYDDKGRELIQVTDAGRTLIETSREQIQS